MPKARIGLAAADYHSAVLPLYYMGVVTLYQTIIGYTNKIDNYLC